MERNKSKLYTGYHVLSNDTIDDRLVLTKDELMHVINGTSADPDLRAERFPDKYFAVVTDSEDSENPTQLYVFDKSGSFGNSEGHYGYYHRVDYEYIKKLPMLNGKVLMGDHSGDYYMLQDELIASEGIAIDGKLISVKVDGQTIVFTSEGKLQTTILPGVAIDTDGNKINARFDDVTVKVDDSENKLYVPIDEKTIYVTSEGKIAARPEALKDGLATHAHYVNDSEVVDVLVDNKTVGINAANELYVKSAIKEGKAIKVVASEGLSEVNVIPGIAISVDNNKVDVKVDDTTIKVVDDKLHANIDEKTVYLNADGKLSASKPSDGDGTKVIEDATNHQFRVHILPDPMSIKIIGATKTNPDSKVAVKLDPARAITTSSTDGIGVNVDNKSVQIVDNKLSMKLTGRTGIQVAQSSDNTYLNIKHDSTIKEIATGSTNPTELIGVNFDERTIQQNVDGKLFVPIDGTTITYDATNKVIHASKADVKDALAFDSENKLNVLYDNSTIKLDATGNRNHLYVPLEEETLMMTPGGDKVGANIDTKSIIRDGANGMRVQLADGTISYTDAGLKLPIDEKTIILKDDKLSAVVTEGAGIKIDSDEFDKPNRVAVKIDSETIKLNAEGKLYAVDELPEYGKPNAGQSLRVNSEGTLEWNEVGEIDDVVLDGKSLVKDYVATIPVASHKELGVVREPLEVSGIEIDSEGHILVVPATKADIDGRDVASTAGKYNPITAEMLDYAVKMALSDELGSEYTEIEKFNARKRIGLENAVNSSEAAVAITMEMDDSEYKLVTSLYNKAGDVISTDMVDLPLEEMVIDAEYYEVSEDGFLILTLKNGNKIVISFDQLIRGLVTLRTPQTIVGDKDFTGGLYKLGKDVISVANVDNTTIRWNESEQWIEASGLEVESGEAVEVINAGMSPTGTPIKKVNVMYDHATIILNSENELYVPIDEVTLKINADGKLEAAGLDVKPGEGIKLISSEEAGLPVKYIHTVYDDVTVKVGAANELYVPIDNKTIVIDSEDQVALPLDGVTVYLNSEGEIEAAGLDVLSGDAIEIIESEIAGLPVKYINVKYDDVTIKLDSEGKLKAQGVLPGEAIEFTESEGLQVIDVKYDDVTVKYNDSENFLYVPIDDITIKINADGKLQAAGVEAGIAIELVDSEGTGVNTINVLYDDVTIKLDSEGKLKAQGVLPGEAVEFVEDAGLQVINVKYDDETVKFNDSENVLYVPIDNVTIKIDSEGKLVASGVKAGDAIKLTDSEGNGVNTIDVVFDDKTIKLGADNALYLPIDEETIFLSSEGLLKARPEPLKDGIATSIYYDGEEEIVDVLVDNVTIQVDSEDNNLFVPIDAETIIVDSEGKIAVAIDMETVILTSEGVISVKSITPEAVEDLWNSLI